MHLFKRKISVADERLVPEIKKTLGHIANTNPNWRMIHLGKVWTADQVIEQLEQDKEFRQQMIEQFLGLAMELSMLDRKEQP